MCRSKLAHILTPGARAVAGMCCHSIAVAAAGLLEHTYCSDAVSGNAVTPPRHPDPAQHAVQMHKGTPSDYNADELSWLWHDHRRQHCYVGNAPLHGLHQWAMIICSTTATLESADSGTQGHSILQPWPLLTSHNRLLHSSRSNTHEEHHEPHDTPHSQHCWL